jgi:hypothetical protein
MNHDCFILIAGIPYPAHTREMIGMPDGVEMVELCEAIGKPGEITADEATTFFGEGTAFPVVRAGDHETTGLPLYRFAAIDKQTGRIIPPAEEQAP